MPAKINAMFRAGLNRRLIALVAAYALALQTLLAAVVAAAPFDPLASVVCSTGDAPAPSDAPASPSPEHQLGCVLCPLGCGGAAALPSFATIAVGIDRRGMPLRPPRVAASVARAPSRAGLARAPPA